MLILHRLNFFLKINTHLINLSGTPGFLLKVRARQAEKT